MSQIIPKFDLSYAITDVYYSQKGGLFRNDYDHLLSELHKLQNSNTLPQSYRDNVVRPLINYLLHELPKSQFDRIFLTHPEDLNPNEKSIQSILPVLAEALLQRNYNFQYYKSAFDDLLAFQSIVNTIFDIAVQTTSTPWPPLVAWSRKNKGPFTIPAAQINSNIPVSVGVVCLPPEYRSGGLFAWSVMGHEVAGHNFIKSKPGFLEELVVSIQTTLAKEFSSKLNQNQILFSPDQQKFLCDYWSLAQRVEELASDILGILSTGPSLAIGCIGYFRGMSPNALLKTTGPFEAQKKRDVLHIQSSKIDLRFENLSTKIDIAESQGILGKNLGEEVSYKAYKIPSGPHPIAALRPFAIVEAIRQTSLDKKSKDNWIKLITEEIISKEFAKEKDVKIISMDLNVFPPQEKETLIPFRIACLSAEIVANIITTTSFSSLGNKKITQMFNWTMQDEALVEFSRNSYKKKNKSPPGGASTSHIVAAAVMEASTLDADIESIFQTMKHYLIQVQGKS